MREPSKPNPAKHGTLLHAGSLELDAPEPQELGKRHREDGDGSRRYPFEPVRTRSKPFGTVFWRSDPFIGVQILKTYGFPIWRINFKVSRLAGI